MQRNLYLLLFVLISTGFSKDNSGRIPDLKIKMLDGTKTSIHKFLENGPLMIDFWATWCKPCKKVMIHLDKFHQKYSEQGFKVLMINQDTPRSMGKVKSYIRSMDHQFHVSLDPNKQIATKLNGLIMPTLILVGKDGVIQWRHQGYMPGEEKEIEAQIRSVLGLESTES